MNIERVHSFNFLGVTIDQHLYWNSHVKLLALKLSKTVGILRHLKAYLPLYILITLYKSLILPQLTYGLLA